MPDFSGTGDFAIAASNGVDIPLDDIFEPRSVPKGFQEQYFSNPTEKVRTATLLPQMTLDMLENLWHVKNSTKSSIYDQRAVVVSELAQPVDIFDASKGNIAGILAKQGAAGRLFNLARLMKPEEQQRIFDNPVTVFHMLREGVQQQDVFAMVEPSKRQPIMQEIIDGVQQKFLERTFDSVEAGICMELLRFQVVVGFGYYEEAYNRGVDPEVAYTYLESKGLIGADGHPSQPSPPKLV